MMLIVSPGLTLKLSESTATSPPNRLVRFFTSSRNTLRSRIKSEESSKAAHQPVGHEQYDNDQQRSVNKEIRPREFVAEDFGRQLQKHRSEHRPGDCPQS